MKTLISQRTKKPSTAFATTATIVTTLSIAERGLGFLYRVVLSRMLGAEGLGTYQVALSLFAVFLTIGTGGIPISVSRLISKSKAENNPYGERSALSAGILLSLLFTLPFVLLFGLFPSLSSPFFSDEQGIPVFRILLLGLAFSSLYAVFRGHFWGNKEFLIPSILEIAEESVMVVAGVLLLRRMQSVEQGVFLASWAVVISYLFSFSASFVCFLFKGGKFARPKTQLKPLFSATLPITSVRASGSLVTSAVSILLPIMLIRAGASEGEALTLFGVVSGMAMPVLFIPSTIIGSLSLVLVPELAEDYYRKNNRRLYKNLARGLTTAFLVSCFLLPFFYAVGKELGMLAFSNPLAGEFIQKGCPILIPMSLTMISTGMLNSMGYEKQTFIFYFVGAGTMLLCILFLPFLCGAYAYLIGMSASFLVTALCNLLFLGKKCHGLFRLMRKPNVQNGFRTQAKALLCVLPLSLIGAFLHSLFSRFFGAFLAIAFATCILIVITALLWTAFGILPIRKMLVMRKKQGKLTTF